MCDVYACEACGVTICVCECMYIRCVYARMCMVCVCVCGGGGGGYVCAVGVIYEKGGKIERENQVQIWDVFVHFKCMRLPKCPCLRHIPHRVSMQLQMDKGKYSAL